MYVNSIPTLVILGWRSISRIPVAAPNLSRIYTLSLLGALGDRCSCWGSEVRKNKIKTSVRTCHVSQQAERELFMQPRRETANATCIAPTIPVLKHLIRICGFLTQIDWWQSLMYFHPQFNPEASPSAPTFSLAISGGWLVVKLYRPGQMYIDCMLTFLSKSLLTLVHRIILLESSIWV